MSKSTAGSLRSKTKTELEDKIAERDQRFAAPKNELEQQRNVIDRLNELVQSRMAKCLSSSATRVFSRSQSNLLQSLSGAEAANAAMP
jgi:hypothetical protein